MQFSMALLYRMF